MNDQERDIIGKPLPRIDVWGKVTGDTCFADDLSLPRMAHAKLLRSDRPHALIKRIDTSHAQALPGVYAVITGHDLPKVKFGILPVSQDEETLCLEKVRMVGDPIAAVAASDEQTAQRAVELIKVEYEPLLAIMSLAEALAETDVRIHEYGDGPNIHKVVALEFGAVAAAFDQADLVREDLFFFQGNTHLALEQHAAIAQWSAAGKLTLWSATQTPHYVQRALAKVLELPPAHIRVIAMPVGGGFGGKTDPFSHEIVVCRLSQLTGRPVKLTLTREEVFYCHRGRHPALLWVKSGVTKSGEILGMHFRSYLDGGAYGSYGVASLFYTGALQTVAYQVPNYKFEGVRVFTNKAPCGPKRGHGTPQPRFALECHLDKIAEQLALDPAALRRQIVVAEYTKTANHLTVTTCGLRAGIDRVTAASNWHAKHRQLPFGKGVGFACSTYLTGAGLPIYWNAIPHSGAVVKVDRGGGVTVFCGSTDIGQGSNSMLAYLVAEQLGLTPKDISVVTGDTDLTPVDLGSYSSRVTLMAGNAVLQATERIRELLLAAVAKELAVPQTELLCRGGRIFCRNSPDQGRSFAEAAVLAETSHGTLACAGSYTPPRRSGNFKGAGVGPAPCYSFSACVVELTADPETGKITVEQVWLAHDGGNPLNPLAVTGQVEGSVYMALGEALLEEQIFQQSGVHQTPSLLDYLSPTSLEIPEIHTILVETGDPEGPFGAKEVGQGPLLPVIPAIANALYDALGVRIDEVPITPEKVLKALERKAQGRTPRVGPERLPDFTFPEPLEVPSAFGQPADPAVKRKTADHATPTPLQLSET
ncbi:MAG: molybdopterin-dependent oxidoreductase [Cyanobacteria bacterium NC_groundwater_1444_Ag_S-0.65um_54_12]|nr:molybdopterin-dependent oxidoreductase [Cyanobacteria bacterium NC_groundwater_1444_Ag_S-0.65um_54_12]